MDCSRAHLLQQYGIVPLKCLENIVIAAQGSEAVHSGIAVAATALPADGQRLCCVLCCVRLQACKQDSISKVETYINEMHRQSHMMCRASV